VRHGRGGAHGMQRTSQKTNDKQNNGAGRFTQSRHGNSRAGHQKGSHRAIFRPNCPIRMTESPANLGTSPQ
jgi:hypothetical protein